MRPELAEALEDEPRVADAGDRAEAQHHLLIDIKNRDQQRQSPQERRAVVLAGVDFDFNVGLALFHRFVRAQLGPESRLSPNQNRRHGAVGEASIWFNPTSHVLVQPFAYKKLREKMFDHAVNQSQLKQRNVASVSIETENVAGLSSRNTLISRTPLVPH